MGSNKNNVGFTAIIFICTGAATVLQGTQAHRPTLFYAVKRFSRAKPTLQKWACQFRSDIHARKAIWPVHFIFDTVPIARRHSRTGENDDAQFSDLNLLQNHQIHPTGRAYSLSGNKYQRSSESVEETGAMGFAKSLLIRSSHYG